MCTFHVPVLQVPPLKFDGGRVAGNRKRQFRATALVQWLLRKTYRDKFYSQGREDSKYVPLLLKVPVAYLQSNLINGV